MVSYLFGNYRESVTHWVSNTSAQAKYGMAPYIVTPLDQTQNHFQFKTHLII